MTLRLLTLAAALLCSLPSFAAAPGAPAAKRAAAKSATAKELAKWPPRPFSGEMVITSKQAEAPPVRQRVYFSQGRMRMEMDLGGQPRAMVTDLVKKKAYMLMPQQKVAMDMSAVMERARDQTHPLTQEHLAASGGDLCASTAAGRKCEKLGSDQVQGRAATRWRMTEKDGTRSTVWMDDALVVMLRHESEQGTVELQNLKEGPQPDSLFQVPAGFKVIQQPAGMPRPRTP